MRQILEMHQRKQKNFQHEGTTILEALVVFAIFLMISGALVALYIQHQTVFGVGQTQFQSVGSARRVMNSLETYITQARRVVSSYSVTTSPYVSGTTTLVLEIPAINAGGGIVENSYDYVVFATSGPALFLVVSPSAASARTYAETVLSSNIEAVLFAYDNDDVTLAQKVTVSVTSTATVQRSAATHGQTASFNLRNYQ